MSKEKKDDDMVGILGPWRKEDGGLLIFDRTGAPFADVTVDATDHDNPNWDQAESRAQLIATAPEIYDCLKRATILIESLGYIGSDFDYFRVIISKAEGRS
jgi:hypothetical protein